MLQTEKPPENDPRERLLDAAERLFAEYGYRGVSIRTITAAAGVNLAAAHYYYRSKLALFQAVFERRVVPMNAERMRLLEIAWPDQAKVPDLEEVLSALIGPTLRIGSEPGVESFRTLSGRSATDPSPEVRETVFGLYDDVAPHFVKALRKIRPDLGEKDLLWRLSCIYGAMMYVRADSGRPHQLLNIEHGSMDVEEVMHHIVPYLMAIFELPAIKPPEGNDT